MPELPDLIYIKNNLKELLPGRVITNVEIKNPIVIREIASGNFSENLVGKKIGKINIHGPFLKIEILPFELIIHFMLVGKLQYAKKGEKPIRDICFSIFLDNDHLLHYGDEKQMGKVYLTNSGEYEKIKGYLEQGIDILSSSFTYESLEKLLLKTRQQVRAFLIDKKRLSAVGNAYADEMLFQAKIFPKTPCNQLSEEEKKRLYDSIKKITQWGIEEINNSGKPIHIKVREHMRIRNRNGQPCPECNTKIRRLNVSGYDSFYCPSCQPSKDKGNTLW